MRIKSIFCAVKRFEAAMLAGLLVASPVFAQTSSLAQVNLAGSFNGFDTLTANMSLVANNTWQGELEIPTNNFRFKFSTAFFAQNWGVNTPPHTTLPLAMTGVSGGGDIYITNPPIVSVSGSATNITTNYLLRFTFNDLTREFSVMRVGDTESSDFLYNSGFETAGSVATRARYWESGNPNIHGAMLGTAERQGSNWSIRTQSGQWVGLMKGRWANQGNSGTWWQEAPVEAGITYEASAWFQPEAAPNAWTAAVHQLRLEYYDFNRTNLLATFTRDLTGIPQSNTNWVQQFISGSAPVGAGWGRLVVFVDGIGPSGTYRIDSAALRATVAKRTEDFNEWTGATLDGTYIKGGWTVTSGRTVSVYAYSNQFISLARSGFAASLASGGTNTTGGHITSPRFNDGVGTVSFYYRHGYQGGPDENAGSPVHLEVQRSLGGQSYTTVATVSNIVNTSYRRLTVTVTETSRYVRIIHNGGSTNRIIIDDIAIGLPEGEPRLMDFNTWTDTTTNGYYYKNGWELSNGLVSATFALDQLSGQIAGNTNSQHALYSPVFIDGYGTISFDYRAGADSARTLGFVLESRTHPGTNWVELDRITNINTMTWQQYSRFFYAGSAQQLRIRNLAETNTSAAINTDIFEGFTADGPPSGWTFENIGYYTSASTSGTNSGQPALRFDSSIAKVTSPALVGPTSLSFMIMGQSAAASNVFTVEGLASNTWLTLTNIAPISGARTYYNLRLTGGVSQLRFSYNKLGTGNVSFDDFLVKGQGFANPTAPQRLILDNIEVAAPVIAREQNFDSWPTKGAYTSGTTLDQGWLITGPTKVDASKPFAGQSLTLSRQTVGGGGSSATDYIVNFEGPSETKTVYGSATVSLSGLNWDLTDTLIGTDANDWKNGTRSARLRGYGTTSMTMLADKTNGLGTLSFNFQRYGTDGQTSYQVQLSTNSGTSWFNVGSTFTPTATTQTFSHSANIAGNVRVKIKENSGTGASNRRANVDDITLTGYSAGGGGGPTTNSALYSPFLPGGIGPITFQYRHSLDTPPPPASVLTAAIQTSPDGLTWTNAGTLVISNTAYAAYDVFISRTNHFYARIILTNGIGDALFDNVSVQSPQPPAIVILSGSTFPPLPFTNDAVKLVAEVSPLYGAFNISVTSYYRIGTSGAFTALAMASLGDNQFETTTNIPAQPKGTIVQYYMAAWYDGPGASSTRPVYYPAGATNELARYGIPRNPPGKVWINEIDYRSFNWASFTSGEFVELAGLAGVDISGWKIELLDGTTNPPALFGSFLIPTNTLVANDTNGFGFYVLGSADMTNPVPDLIMTNYMNDPMEFNVPGVVKLVNELGGVEHSVSYGGYVEGAERILALDEDYSFDYPPTQTVALVGIGFGKDQFDWGTTTPRTPGAVNQGQTFGTPPSVTPLPASLTFTYLPGSVNPGAQLLVISNSGGAGLSYSLSDNAAWLIVSPLTASNLAAGATQIHTVRVETAGLNANRSGSITVSGNAVNTPVIVPVQLNETAISSALVDYSFDNILNGMIINDGSLGTAGDLLLTNGATRTLEGQGVSGSLGDFAYLSSTNSAIATTINALAQVNTQNVFTITGWLRPAGTSGVHRMIGNLSGTNGFELATATNTFMFRARNLTWWSTNAVIASNTWTFYAVTYDGTKTASNAVAFYFGSVAGSTYSGATVSPTGTLTALSSTNRLLVGGDGTNGFRGRVDDLRIYAGQLDLMTMEAVRKDGATSLTGTGSAPYINQQPQGAIYTLGMLGNAKELNVLAEGEPLPSYQWRKDGTNIAGAVLSTFTIPATATNDAGRYDVVVFSTYGSVTSDLAEITVVLAMPTNLYVYPGDTAIFQTRVNPDTARYTWMSNSVPVATGTSNSYRITNFNSTSAVPYSVIISNQFGSVTSGLFYAYLVQLDFDAVEGAKGVDKPANATNIVLSWPSVTNRYYDILWTTNLLAGTDGFTVIASNLPGTPAVNIYTDAVNGARTHGFYRIKAKESP